MQGMKLISNIVACAALALSGQVFAQTAEADNSNKGDAAKGQQIATQVCAACHNADGNSLIPANPILAGQHAEYIIKQLNNYKSKDGKPPVRESPIMNAMVEPLSPEDMKNLGAYFAQQIPRPGVANDKSLAEQGEQLYRGGNLETSVPACTGCHSPNGAGLPPNYPRLAGQHSEYTAAQLRAFRTDQRTNDENDVMQMITSRMTEKELRAVAEFISGLR
ncbi:c-type cytochrome [Nitrosovibrio sp. Nv6]|uniref:c-type cytochrome n=1 Tax=Nitrosovibrio sp. Nv6 TaxID=1855340 RepID=UPI0008AABD08|nr:c-type cytochrome [Nitrosovibrio sp. Nv6]SEP11190.1 Cytochrome c553 [Nitrosovibrio sp. Nv6]